MYLLEPYLNLTEWSLNKSIKSNNNFFEKGIIREGFAIEVFPRPLIRASKSKRALRLLQV